MPPSDITVSVIMACHNAEKYIGEAISSVLSQTYDDLELIVVDDASSDSSRAVVARWAEKDRRIRVHTMPERSGPALARNAAIGIARGRWLGVLDADDIALPDRLAKELSFAERNPSLVLLGTGCTLIDGDGRTIGSYRYPTRHQSLVAHMGAGRSPFPNSSTLSRRETVVRIGGFNPRFAQAEDTDLWFKLGEAGRIACLPEPLVKIRKHTSNISNNGALATSMGMAARACHFIRSRGASDPAQGDNDTWIQFTCWLSRRLEEESYVGLQREWSNIRRDLYSSVASRSRLHRASALAKRLLTSGHACRIIHDKVFGSRLALRLADEWIKGHAQTPEAG